MTLKEKLTQKQKELNAAYGGVQASSRQQMDALADRQNQAEIRLANIEAKVGSVQKNIDAAQDDLEAARKQLNERVVQMYKDGFSSAPAYVEVLFADADFSSVLERLSYLGKMADQDQDLFTQVSTYLQEKQSRESRSDRQAAGAERDSRRARQPAV